MLTLYHKHNDDPVWDAIVESKNINEKLSLLEVCNAAINGNLKLTNHKQPKAYFTATYKGHTYESDAMRHIYRMVNLLNRAPEVLEVSEDDDSQTVLDWFVNEGAQDIRNLISSNSKIVRNLVHQLAQVAEKGFKEEYRQNLGIGVVNGEIFKGPVYEAVQAQMYFDAGGPGIPDGKTAKKYHITNDGDVGFYRKENRNKGGKQLDLYIETEFLQVYATCKAQTATKDGGGRTSEYEQDLGATLSKRHTRWLKKGYEYAEDGKLIIVAGLIDSRFFHHNPHAVRLIQTRAGTDISDTFVSDSRTFAKFINKINVPGVLETPNQIIEKAFKELAVEI